MAIRLPRRERELFTSVEQSASPDRIPHKIPARLFFSGDSELAPLEESVRCFTSSVQRGQKLKDARKLDMRARIEYVFPLAATRVRRDEARVSKNKFRDRSNSELEKKLESVDVGSSSKNSRLRSDTIIERDRASNWKRTPLGSTALHGTIERKCSS